jgi:hypothetical protein
MLDSGQQRRERSISEVGQAEDILGVAQADIASVDAAFTCFYMCCHCHRYPAGRASTASNTSSRYWAVEYARGVGQSLHVKGAMCTRVICQSIYDSSRINAATSTMVYHSPLQVRIFLFGALNCSMSGLADLIKIFDCVTIRFLP